MTVAEPLAALAGGDAAVWGGLAAASFAAGAVNAIAGGGTIIAFPVIAAALPADAARLVSANATSTVGLWPGAVAAAWALRHTRDADRHWTAGSFVPSIVGAASGAALVLASPTGWFDAVVPWLILTAAVLFAVQPWIVSRPFRSRHGGMAPVIAGCGQFLVALYGGYFGAGIGILVLALLGSSGVTDIHRANAAKNLLTTAINGTAAAVFAIVSIAGIPLRPNDGAAWGVSWPHAIVMACGAVGGGLAGALLARRMRPAVVRRVVAIIGFALAGYYLWRQYA